MRNEIFSLFVAAEEGGFPKSFKMTLGSPLSCASPPAQHSIQALAENAIRHGLRLNNYTAKTKVCKSGVFRIKTLLSFLLFQKVGTGRVEPESVKFSGPVFISF